MRRDRPPLPKRPYRDDVELSVIGLGGVVLNGLPQEDADRIVSEVALRPFALHQGEASVELTISLGLGLYPSGSVRSHSELLDAASIAVARARVAGPNRVCVVQQQGYIFRPTLTGAA